MCCTRVCSENRIKANHNRMNGPRAGAALTTKLLLRKVSNYYILKAKAPTFKPFADICSIKEPFLVLKSRPDLTSQVIPTEKTLKLQRHIVLYNEININSKKNNHMHNVTYRFFEIRVIVKVMTS